jgi:hypothetical protein
MKRIRNRQLAISRTFLIVVGAVLLAGAVIAGLLATGTVDHLGNALDSDTALLNADGLRLLYVHPRAFQFAVLGIGVLLIVVGIVWLKNQIPPHRRQEDHSVETQESEVAGRNTVAGGALAHALENDLARSPYVERARAEFRGEEGVVRLRLDIDDDSSADEIVHTVVAPAVDRVTTVAELPGRPSVQIDLRPVSSSVSRVS